MVKVLDNRYKNRYKLNTLNQKKKNPLNYIIKLTRKQQNQKCTQIKKNRYGDFFPPKLVLMIWNQVSSSCKIRGQGLATSSKRLGQNVNGSSAVAMALWTEQGARHTTTDHSQDQARRHWFSRRRPLAVGAADRSLAVVVVVVAVVLLSTTVCCCCCCWQQPNVVLKSASDSWSPAIVGEDIWPFLCIFSADYMYFVWPSYSP